MNGYLFTLPRPLGFRVAQSLHGYAPRIILRPPNTEKPAIGLPRERAIVFFIRQKKNRLVLQAVWIRCFHNGSSWNPFHLLTLVILLESVIVKEQINVTIASRELAPQLLFPLRFLDTPRIIKEGNTEARPSCLA